MARDFSSDVDQPKNLTIGRGDAPFRNDEQMGQKIVSKFAQAKNGGSPDLGLAEAVAG